MDPIPTSGPPISGMAKEAECFDLHFYRAVEWKGEELVYRGGHWCGFACDCDPWPSRWFVDSELALDLDLAD
jgi:hypothetical protein